MKSKINLGLLLCAFMMMFGWSSCSKERDEVQPAPLNDNELVESQLKLLKTRSGANEANTIIITTASSFSMSINYASDLIVNWGDGTEEINGLSHTYTDNLPVHTICIYGSQDAITSIHFNANEVIFVDVSRDTALYYFGSLGNRLTKLDLSNNKNLVIFKCFYEQISSLDFSQNHKLLQLVCYNSELRNLKLPINTSLKTLKCDYNNLDSLDLSSSIHLNRLNCNFNRLKKLDFSHNVELDYVLCSNNQISTLNGLQDTLETLNCSYNQITSLNLSRNKALQTILCDNNRLDDLVLPNTTKLDTINCSYNIFSTDPDKMLQLISQLPDRRNKDKGRISINNVSNLSTLQMFGTVLNWDIALVD